jgi:predicted transcriptional regulator
MNTTLLIHAIVRQTTVLVATLATASGQRAQLASVANLVFTDLVRELREQGLGNKVIADMFGMALRTYRRRVARLSGSRTVQGHSLWEAVLAHVQEHGPVQRSELLQRFVHDDEATVRAVVYDLAESGVVEIEGTDDSARIAAAPAAAAIDENANKPGKLEAMLLVALHRSGPLRVSELTELVPATAAELTVALEHLVDGGMVTTQNGEETSYACQTFLIPFGDELGWEAAVFDHYQAMVVALTSKLRAGKRRAEIADAVGGSTFVFDLWQGHPMESEILGYLRATRKRGMTLRRSLEAFNAAAKPAEGATALRVTSYVGQSVIETETEQAHE